MLLLLRLLLKRKYMFYTLLFLLLSSWAHTGEEHKSQPLSNSAQPPQKICDDTVMSMQDAQVIRQRVWAELKKFARPHPRYQYDFSSFIPDFEGSNKCADRLFLLDVFRGIGNKRIFVTPDDCTIEFRHRLLIAGKSFVIATGGIKQGFLDIDPEDVPNGEYHHAATLDGVYKYGRHKSLSELKSDEVFGLLVTGSSVVDMNGVRFGKGHGYFDLEWAILSELGLTNDETVIAAVVHDCQVVDEPLHAESHDTVVDWIITPTRSLHIKHCGRLPGKLRWEDLGKHADLGVIEECRTILDMKLPDEEL